MGPPYRDSHNRDTHAVFASATRCQILLWSQISFFTTNDSSVWSAKSGTCVTNPPGIWIRTHLSVRCSIPAIVSCLLVNGNHFNNITICLLVQFTSRKYQFRNERRVLSITNWYYRKKRDGECSKDG